MTQVLFMEIYMAFDQTKAFTQLEVLVKEKNKDTFFFDFMLAFKTPRATITKLKKNIGSVTWSTNFTQPS